ncbi:MAG: putative integral rane protein [Microbacteriaceae bacterium]|nr:putative integral rane protein [Microbacteriaceae bacterium]
MTPTLAVLLLFNGVFNAIVWPTFFRRVARDPRSRGADGAVTPFFTVHLVIVVVALLLAAASLVAGISALVGIW